MCLSMWKVRRKRENVVKQVNDIYQEQVLKPCVILRARELLALESLRTSVPAYQYQLPDQKRCVGGVRLD